MTSTRDIVLFVVLFIGLLAILVWWRRGERPSVIGVVPVSLELPARQAVWGDGHNQRGRVPRSPLASEASLLARLALYLRFERR